MTEMLTPDFFLQDVDLYVELTTMKQSLVTEKNRKLRRFRELYPDTNIKLLYRRDYHRMLAKYGFGPLAQSEVRGIDRVLFTAPTIERKVSELGRNITRDYKGRQPVLVGVLKGMLCFMADLMRAVSLPAEIEFMAISRYRGRRRSSGVRITKDLDSDLDGKDVILVEDIIDSGMTLNYLVGYLSSKNPASLEVCTLLDKRVRRLVDVPIKYVGFEVARRVCGRVRPGLRREIPEHALHRRAEARRRRVATPYPPGADYIVARLTRAWKIRSGISLAPSMPSLASIPTGWRNAGRLERTILWTTLATPVGSDTSHPYRPCLALYASMYGA